MAVLARKHLHILLGRARARGSPHHHAFSKPERDDASSSVWRAVIPPSNMHINTLSHKNSIFSSEPVEILYFNPYLTTVGLIKKEQAFFSPTTYS